jgi:NAD(P)H-dependent FMN reductase
MSEPMKVLIVVGSPRGRQSVSHVLAAYLAECFALKSVETEIVHVPRPDLPVGEEEQINAAMDSADQVFLFFPLYVDQLPSGVVAFLERYARHRETVKTGRLRSVAALCNSGFPEAQQSDQALAVIRRFAELQGLHFLGGLALGGGGVVQTEKPLGEQGGKAARIRKVLQLSADALAEGRDLPRAAVEGVRHLPIPAFLYAWIAEAGFRWEGHKKKIDLRAKPYADAGMK